MKKLLFSVLTMIAIKNLKVWQLFMPILIVVRVLKVQMWVVII